MVASSGTGRAHRGSQRADRKHACLPVLPWEMAQLGSLSVQKASYKAAMEKIRGSGGEIVYPVELVHPKQNGIGKAMDTIFGKPKYQVEGSAANNQADYEPRGVIAKYLETMDDPNMKSLEDIAKFNIEHADLELPEGGSTRRPLLCDHWSC